MEFTGERLLTEKINKTTIEHLHRYAFALQFVKNKKVVDVASGEGYGSNLLATIASDVTGVDISKETIDHAKSKYQKDNLRFVIGAATKIPLETNTIDVVISFETIEHHDKHQEMINDIKRILKKDGLLIISSPDKLNYSVIPNFQNKYHVKELFIDEFQDLIKANFFNAVFYNQKVNYSSLITSSGKMNFHEFSGNFNCIESSENIKNPEYNIAVASNSDINITFSSSFDGHRVFDNLVEALDSVYKSRTYKLGSLLLWPLLKLKRLFNS